MQFLIKNWRGGLGSSLQLETAANFSFPHLTLGGNDVDILSDQGFFTMGFCFEVGLESYWVFQINFTLHRFVFKWLQFVIHRIEIEFDDLDFFFDRTVRIFTNNQ